MNYQRSRIRIRNACLLSGESIFNFYNSKRPDNGSLYFHRSAKYFEIINRKLKKHFEVNPYEV